MKITNEKLLANGYTFKSKAKIPTGDHYKYYWLCWKPLGHGKYSKQFEHILICESEFGPIPKGYIVHHKDNDGLNNNIDNLAVMSRAEHAWTHSKKIYIDGELMTLDRVTIEFGYYNKCNTVKALKRYINKPSKYSRFYGHEVQYV